MRIFSHPLQAAHRPSHEFHNGGLTPYADVPARLEIMLRALGPVEVPTDAGMAPILAVHDAAYCQALQDVPRL